MIAAVLAAFQGVSAEMDDSVLVEQIQVSVKQYRRALQDFNQLQASLPQEGRESGAMASPKLQEFIQVSLSPAEKELRGLFARYEREYGRRAFLKLAKKRGFPDLISR